MNAEYAHLAGFAHRVLSNTRSAHKQNAKMSVIRGWCGGSGTDSIAVPLAWRPFPSQPCQLYRGPSRRHELLRSVVRTAVSADDEPERERVDIDLLAKQV
jgi:hypothetical protein